MYFEVPTTQYGTSLSAHSQFHGSYTHYASVNSGVSKTAGGVPTAGVYPLHRDRRRGLTASERNESTGLQALSEPKPNPDLVVIC